MTMNRRELVKLLGGVGLIGGGAAAMKLAVDSTDPKRGILGSAERLNEKLESALVSDYEPSPRGVTPPGSFPAYHVASEVPQVYEGWHLSVSGRVAQPLRLSLADIHRLPSTTVTIRHYCVEGWSAVAEWTGVRLAEIAKLAGAKDTDYLEARSFDVAPGATRGYWSSWDRESAMHPQTLIAYGMNGKPLTPAYGAPIKLYGAVKLGYKNVKYLSELNFLDQRTGGYWENQGYEWFAGV